MSLALGCNDRRRSFSPFNRSFVVLQTFGALLLSGCGSSAHVLLPAETSSSFAGSVHVAGQPVNGALVQLYGAGTGSSSSSIPLLKRPVHTDAAGRFTVSESYTCPLGSPPVYVLATGGVSVPNHTSANDADALMAVLGTCDDLANSSAFDVSELTTTASVAALSSFMHSPVSIAASSADTRSLRDAFTAAEALAESLQQANADPNLPQSQLDSIQKLASLANVVSACSATAGGKAGDGTPCGSFFSSTQSAQGTSPQDTITALLAVANEPTHNVASIFSLSTTSSIFRPALASAPQDWSIVRGVAPAQPVFSPVPGSYDSPQAISLSDATPDARIFYSTDGIWHPYTVPFTLPASKSIQSMALLGMASLPSTGTYSIAAPTLSVATPSVLLAGQTVTGTVTISTPAPAGGVVVNLQSSSSSIAAVASALVMIPSGQTSATFTYKGLRTGSATVAASATSFTAATAQVTVATPKLVFITEPASAAAGSVLSPPPTVAIEDSTGALIPSATYLVTLALSANSSGGVLRGTTTATASNGLATFPSLTIPTPGTGYTFVASASGALSVTSNPFNNTGNIALIPMATTLLPGQATSGFFTLSEPAPAGGAVVTLASSDPTVTSISPGAVTVPQGQSAGNFTYKNITGGTVTLSASAASFTAGTVQIVTAGVAVTMTPYAVSLSASQSQKFTASVTGTSNAAVNWLLNPAVGSISSSGLYQAPASVTTAQTVTVTAATLADPSKSTTATISLIPSTTNISISPVSETMSASQAQQFTASVTGASGTGVVWSVSPAVGSISASGLYTTPTTVSTGQVVTITATSVADGTKKASATITLTSGVVVTLTPGAVTVVAGQTQQFSTGVTGTTNTALTWSLSPAIGTITSYGLYTAPNSFVAGQVVNVVATSVADSSKSAYSPISLVSTIGVSISPTTAVMSGSQAQQFTASVAGASNSGVTWSLSPAVGSLSVSGLYTAPASLASGQVITVTATSIADATKKASAYITLTNPVSVTLTPGSASVIAGGTQQFSSMVAGTTNTALAWSISPALGSITSYGLYTAPTSFVGGQVVNIVATSVADPTKSAYVPVMLIAAPITSGASSGIGVTMTPASVSLYASQIQQYSVYVTGTRNTGITFSISPAAGSVSQVGLYTAPASITSAQTVSVIATSNADGISRAVSSVSLVPPVTFATTTTIPANFFGMSVFNFHGTVPPMTFATTRSWDSYPDLSWAATNTAPGVYNFALVDSFIAVNQARGADMIYTLGRTPQWASYLPNQPGNYGPGQCAAPANFANYDAYITALATHVAGKIKYWELWNEADDPNYYCGDVGSMVVMAQHASRIIKSIDPTAMILSPGITGGPGPAWLASFLALGGGNSVDIIAFHGYGTANAEDFVGVISGYRAVLAAASLSSKPMWDTESSWAGTGNIGTPTAAAQVAFVAKDYLLHWSQGISRFVWYAYDGGSIWGGMLTSTNSPSTAATSYEQTYRWMVGASLSTPCSEDFSTQIWTCGLTRSNGYTAEAIWLTGSSHSVTVPSQYIEYRDLAGNVVPISGHIITVGDQPLLLESAPLQ